MLHTQGRTLADDRGGIVALRGVNLGSWLFHETWISGVDYPVHGRLHVLGSEMGIGDEVDAALREVGPEDGEGWLPEFMDALEERAGSEQTGRLLDLLESCPSIYDDSDLLFRNLLETRFGSSTSWGLRGRLGPALDRPDVHRDGFDDLRRTFEAYGGLVLLPNDRLLGILRDATEDGD
jgi:hypothetical protein